jgi:hypothetical protein
MLAIAPKFASVSTICQFLNTVRNLFRNDGEPQPFSTAIRELKRPLTRKPPSGILPAQERGFAKWQRKGKSLWQSWNETVERR